MESYEKKYPANPDGSGFLNSDDAPFSLGINEWCNAENIRTGSTDAGVINTVESIGSNVLKSTPQPSVTFLEIGTADDIPNNRFFVFKYNTTGTNHKITYFDIDADTEYDVLLSSQVTGGLNFSKDYPIHSAKVVGNLLYWTDNYNEPRRINVDAAIKLNNPSYDTDETAYTSPLSQSVITIIRRPPGRVLALQFSTDPARENFLKTFAGQFAIGYVYRDGEESAFGEPSNMVNYRYDFGSFSGASSDATNVVSMEINTPALDGELIDQDVQIVQYAVRYGNSNQYFIIKEWNKDNPDDAAEIAAYNAGGALTYDFYNDKIGVPVSISRSIKAADSVPLLSETLETGLSRLFLANNLKGYDTPAETSLTGSVTPAAVAGVATPIFHSYSTYQLGLRFRDNYKRQSGVVTNNDLVIEIPDRGDYNDTTFVENISWTLSNTAALDEIPDWAYYVDILITKNLRTRYFVQWIPNSIKYVIKNLDGTFTYQNTYTGGIYGIAFGTSFLSLQGMGVVYSEGDFVRLYTNGLTPAPFSLAVIAQDADYIIAIPIDLGDTSTVLSTPVMLEYYTPYLQEGQEPFYTTGQGYRITNPGTDLRQYSQLSGSINGDVFFTSRVYAPFVATSYTESMSPNDSKWQDWYDIYGEQNFVTLLGQVRKETAVQWSDVLIEGSLTNGLSTFDPFNEKILSSDVGAIQKLQQTSKVEKQGNIMLAICEKETASLYLGEVQTYGADQQAASVNTVSNVIGTVNILKGNFGTINPESVTEYRGNVYWADANNGRIIQYSSNGLFPISNYKMTRFWKLWFTQFLSMTSVEIEALGGRPFIFMTVDPRHDELLISIPKLSNTPPKGYLPDYPSTIYPFDIYDLQDKVIVYELSLGQGRPKWKGAYTFYTEGFIGIQNNLYSFKQGHIWLHNQTNTTNNFYGVQCKSKLMCVSNIEPAKPKLYNNISISANLCPTFVYFYNDYPIQQSSDLVDYSFRDLEGIWYSVILRNKLVPTATGFNTNGLLTGEKMRNVAMFVLLEFSPVNTFLELKFVNFGIIPSVGHTA